MKHWPPPPPPRPRRRRVPPFTPVPAGARHDGWTLRRQADFIGMLAETRSVLAAARFVSMSREGAYRLRKRPGADSFALAWDVAIGLYDGAARHRRAKFTEPPLLYRLEVGLIEVVVHAGRYRGYIRKADSYGLIRHLSQIARGGRAEGGFGGKSQRSQRGSG